MVIWSSDQDCTVYIVKVKTKTQNTVILHKGTFSKPEKFSLSSHVYVPVEFLSFQSGFEESLHVT